MTRPRSFVSLFSVLIAVASSPAVAAQGGGPPGGTPPGQGGGPPGPQPLALGSVAVTPDGATTANKQPNAAGEESFVVKNTGSSAATFTITCFGRINVTCTGTDLTNVTLNPGASTDVTAFYNVGGVGTGRLVLKASASAQDTGWYNVPVFNKGAPVAALRNHNGDHRDRSLCLTSGAGEAAASQCGDLLVAHGLPGYATLGRARSLSLVYSSAQAVPRPVVVASVSQASVATPTSVFVKLLVNGTARDSATFTGWGSAPFPRQVALRYDAIAAGDTATGLYPFTLVVRNTYPSGGPYETVVSDTLIIVNRAASPFGTGWHLVGVEQLVTTGQPGNKILWVGGDGSAKVYRNIGTNTWRAAAGAFRDTLRYDPGTGTYTRTVRHRIQVKFDVGGRHIQTVNRTGQTTTFTWTGNPPRLTSIQVPPGGTGTTYTLTYDGAGKLDAITDPAGRVLNATVASGRLTSLTDPDGIGTGFAYDAAGRLLGRTNRRGFTTRYAYANGLRLTIDSVRLDSATAVYGITTFQPWDEKGLATGPSGQIAVDTALAYTKIDGPRPAAVGDTAEFWVDRWGAPVKIRDPLGNVTLLKRGDAANPALVTRVQTPDGRIVGAAYDAPRARLLWTADSTYEGTGTTQVVTTRFFYDSATNSAVPDSPIQVRTPAETTKFAYDTTLGLPDSVIAQGGHRTKFAYITSGAFKGLAQSVTERAVRVVDTVAWTKDTTHLVTSFLYNAWGNDSIVTSPKLAQTRYERDAYQRVIRVRDPLNHVTEHAYDLLNRDTAVVVYDPTGLKTRYRYTRTGAVDSVIDPRTVKRTWTYDAGDRPTTMKDDVAVTETRYFGPSGLLDSLRTRRGRLIRHRYDAAGRQMATIYPVDTNTFGLGAPHDSVVPGDSLAWMYDAVGRPLTVSHSASTITFTYNKEGTVKTERQVVKDDNGQVIADTTMRYWYDAAGRRTKFVNGTDTITYTYGADARPSKLKVKWPAAAQQPADSFFFFWDGLGRRDSLIYATPQVHVSMGYDKDGHLRMVCAKHLATHQNNQDRLEQRVRYPAVDADGQPLAYRRYYGGTTSPACSATLPYADIADYTYDARHQLRTDGKTYGYDVSGNRVSARTGTGLEDSLAYVTGSNRVGWRYGESGNPPQVFLERTLDHDANGSRTRDLTGGGQGGQDSKLYYYDALGQQWAVKSYILNGGSFQWVGPVGCRYDAIGRQTRACDAGGSGGRAAFDGDNVVRLGETSWRFVHGPGVDDPLIGLHSPSAGVFEKNFYLTDGRSRQLAFTDSLGNDLLVDLSYTRQGGNRAGAIDRSHTFANSRAETADAPSLSFYRNRYYDQTTGRWTQEDPIGIAGGVNLYQYVGNNPLTFTDPFGLCTKEDGWKDCDRMISKEQSYQVLYRAAVSGEWSYTQDPSKVNYAARSGDCTDYCRNAVQEGVGDAWAGGPKANTAAFKAGDAAGFTEVESDAARPGDIVVQGGHAGVFMVRAPNGDVWGLANNGRPGKDSRTGPRKFNEGSFGSGQPRFFRPLRPEEEQ